MTATIRPLPSLAQFLGDGARGEGWDELEAFARNYMNVSSSRDNAELVRFLRLFSLAAVEGARQSSEAGTDYGETVSAMAFAAGLAIAAAAASGIDKEDLARLDDLREIINELMASGVTLMLELQKPKATP